jgi:hypothetical protein
MCLHCAVGYTNSLVSKNAPSKLKTVTYKFLVVTGISYPYNLVSVNICRFSLLDYRFDSDTSPVPQITGR